MPPAKPRYEHWREDGKDGLTCLDCGCRIDTEAAHTKFHAILSSYAWALAILQNAHIGPEVHNKFDVRERVLRRSFDNWSAEALAEVAQESQLKADPEAGGPAMVVRSDEVGPAVYLSVGNTDGMLSPQAWSEFIKAIEARVASMATEALCWFSDPRDPWQSACWMFQFKTLGRFATAQAIVTNIRKEYHQDSAAWAFVPETKFI
jgi:hypothetical protein